MSESVPRILSWVHPRARTGKFWLILGVGALAMVMVVKRVERDWALTFSDETQQSLDHVYFVVHKADHHVVRGQYVAFRVGPGLKRYPEGTGFMKVAVGMPGDRVQVTACATYVNGDRVAGGLDLMKPLGQPATAFERSFIVPPNNLFVVGTRPFSYDSRYWGLVPASRIVGRGYALW
ncbi:MAG: S26 family signal peptidase [Rhodanobacter sp.]